MVKNTKVKILLAIMLIVFLVTSYCYATEPTDVTSDGSVANILSSATEGDNQVTSTDTSTQSDKSDWTNSDYFACNENVTVTGVIDGNAYVIGNEVTIKGEIGGDLFVMANKLNVDGGYVYSSIFAMANEFTMNGISYDLYALCSSFNLGSNGFVYRDLKVAGSSVKLAGRIRRDAYIESGSLDFDSSVGTIIYGNLNYSSNADSYTAPDGVVAGEVKYSQDKVESPEVDKDKIATISIGAIIIKHIKDLLSTLITTLIVTLIIAFLATKFKEKLGSMKVGKAFASLGIGILSPVALGLIVALLFILGIILQVAGLGISVAGTLIFIFITLSVVATAVTSTFFGNLFAKLIKKDGKIFFILFSLLSALVIWIIGLIPVLGGLVGFLAWAFGLGSIILNVLPSKKAKAE